MTTAQQKTIDTINATGSEWISIDTLNKTHKVNFRVIRNMVYDGILEEKRIEGSCSEVRVAH